MDTTVIQVRDVPVSVVAVLTGRADARGMSLSAFLGELLANEAARLSIDDVMATIARRAPIDYEIGDLRHFIGGEC